MKQPTTHKQLKRHKKIIATLREKNRITKQQLAESNECSGKTIQRDINKLKSDNWRIIHDELGYFLKPEDKTDLKTTANNHIAAMVLLGCSIDKHLGRYFPALVDNIQKQYIETSDLNTFSYSPTSNAIHAERCSFNAEQLGNFGALARYIIDEIAVTFMYRNVYKPVALKRTVFPIKLTQHESVWYLIAYDLKRCGIRCYSFAKIKDVLLSPEPFSAPPESTIEQAQCYGDFSIWDHGLNNQKASLIEVELRGYAADFVRTHKIHHSQRFRVLPDSRVILTLKTNDFIGVKLWLRKFVHEVKILKPEELKQQYLDDLNTGISLMEE